MGNRAVEIPIPSVSPIFGVGATGDALLPLRVVVKKSAAALVQLKISMRMLFLSIFGLRLPINNCYLIFCLHCVYMTFLNFLETSVTT